LTRRKLPESLSGTNLVLIMFITGGLILLGVASGGEMFSQQGRVSFLSYLSVPVLIGLSQMAVLAVGQINLAVGAMGGASAAIMATSMANSGLSVPLALLLGVVMAVAFGAISGVLVVITGLHGFIVTLGTMTILLGVQYAILGATTVRDYPVELSTFGRQNVLGVPWLFVGTLLAAAVLHVFYSRMVAGRQVLATGGSAVAARLSGVSNSRSIVLSYSISGLFAGLAAVASIASLSGINTTVGADWLLASFAAPLIGGVLLSGGYVAVAGTILAASLIRIVDVARAQFLLDPSWSYFVVGAVVLVTVTATEYRKRRDDIQRQRIASTAP
jgi:ribose transport system permease protein